jgi:hypothetical protein
MRRGRRLLVRLRLKDGACDCRLNELHGAFCCVRSTQAIHGRARGAYGRDRPAASGAGGGRALLAWGALRLLPVRSYMSVNCALAAKPLRNDEGFYGEALALTPCCTG